MKNSNHPNFVDRKLVLLLTAAVNLVVFCGGPYTPKKLNVASEKLALADRLFEKGKYSDAAVEYRDFLASFAGDDRSDYAQFRLAESLRLSGDYAMAEVEYSIVTSDYGYSEYVDDAFYLQAVCALAQAPRIERDQKKTYEALDKVKRFLEVFPNSDRIEEARATLREIHDRLAHKDFLNARLYFSRKAYDSALIYFDKIVELYPETIWATRARYYRAVILGKRGERTEAIREYRAVIESSAMFPELESAKNRLANLGEKASGVESSGGKK